MEITLKNLQKKIPIPSTQILKLVKKAFRKLDSVPINLSIVFVGTKRMRAINKKYLNHDYVTDVLSFNLGLGIGEIVICPHLACTNAKAHQQSAKSEMVLYVIHGILHLAGYDDHSKKDIVKMRQMEAELIGKK